MTSINQTSTVDKPLFEALRLAALGWKVFPAHNPIFEAAGVRCSCGDPECRSCGKHPVMVASWKREATTDPHRIGDWLTRRPAANYGIAAGASGLVVIDFDTSKPEYAGADLLTWLNAEHPTVMARTGSGGRHLFYTAPAGLTLGNGTGNLPAGVDTRGAGGYVVGPGSLHASGRRYEWLIAPDVDCMPAPLPQAVIDLLTVRVQPSPAAAGPAVATGGVISRTVGDQDLVDIGRHNKTWGDEFTRLFDAGDLSAVKGKDQTASGGDFALLKMLAYLTAKDAGDMRRLFEQSALYRPAERTAKHPDYADPGGYLDRTIDAALVATRRVYAPSSHQSDPAAVAAAQAAVNMNQTTTHSTMNGTAPTGTHQTAGPAGAQVANGQAQAVNLLNFPADDAGHADAVLAMHPDQFLYTESLGWLAWTGTHWERDGAEAQLHQVIVEVLRMRRVAAVMAQTPNETLVRSCIASRGRILGVAFCMTMHCHTSIDTFDADPDLLNVANGVLHLPTGQLIPHSPSVRFTYCLPTPYDPAADYSHWTQFLADVVDGGQPVIDFLQMFSGYALTGRTREECLLYVYGPSRAGKGTYAETLTTLLGRPLSAAIGFATFIKRRETGDQGFDLAPLRPARLIVASESNEKDTLNSGMVKSLTGGDQISCAFKNKDQFSYRPIFKPILLSNHQVRADADDSALWGRVRIVQFPHSHLNGEDKHLKDRLKAPASLAGVLRWCVEGAMAWYASPSGLVTPDAVRLLVQQHHAAVDDVGQWLAECTKATSGAWTPNGDLYTSYQTWCTLSGITPKAVNKLGISLANKGYKTGVQRRTPFGKSKGVEDIEII